MRVSTGKVKLRRAGETLQFTVPKSVDNEVSKLVGKEFECVINDDSDQFQICFVALEKPRSFNIRIGGRTIA